MSRVRVPKRLCETYHGCSTFSQCEWEGVTPTEGYVPFPVEKLEEALAQFVMPRVESSLCAIIEKWLFPATVYTEASLFNFTVKQLLNPSLLSHQERVHVIVSADQHVLVLEMPQGSNAVTHPYHMVIGSEEYKQKYMLMISLVEPVVKRVADMLSDMLSTFLERCIDNATPPEMGLCKNNMVVCPVLYGDFQLREYAMEWKLSVHEESAYDTVIMGVLHFILTFCQRSSDEILTQHEGEKSVALRAAKVFTNQLARRYLDVTHIDFTSEIYGVTMNVNGQSFRNLLASVFHCSVESVDAYILSNPGLNPIPLKQLANVAFVVENILFALEKQTLRLPTLHAEGPNMLSRDWVDVRTLVKRALSLAFESYEGVSYRKLRAFAVACQTTSRMFVHVNRCLQLVLNGVMAKHRYSRVEFDTSIGRVDIHKFEDAIHFGDTTDLAGLPLWSSIIHAQRPEEGGTMLCLADAMEKLANIAASGTRATSTHWKRNDLTIKTLTHIPWNYGKVHVLPDPGFGSDWRVLDSLVHFQQVTDLCSESSASYGAFDCPTELVDVILGETVPSFIQVCSSLLGSQKQNLRISVIHLPTFVLLWNGAMVLRKRIRESSALKCPIKKRRRGVSSCTLCLEMRENVAVLECGHDLCESCVMSLMESRARTAVCEGLASGDVFRCAYGTCPCLFDCELVGKLVPQEVFSVLWNAFSVDTPKDVPPCCICGATNNKCDSSSGAVYACSTCGAHNCSQCGRESHPGVVCMRKLDGVLSPEDLLSKAKIQHCPACKTPAVKRRNCNHLICSNCKEHWCWSCSASLTDKDVTVHYRDESLKCASYSVETELQRMEAFLMNVVKTQPNAKDSVDQAIYMLRESNLTQTEDDL